MTAHWLISSTLAVAGISLLSWFNISQNRYRSRIRAHLSNAHEASLLSELQTKLVRKLPNRDLIQLRLKLTGSEMTVKQLRLQQISYATIGLSASALLVLLKVNELSVEWLFTIPIFTFSGWYLPMSSLNSRYQRLKDELNYGFSEVVDLIALSVTAGNSLNHALIQVSELVSPPWRNQFALIRLDLTSGLSVASSLERAAEAIKHETFSKFVNTVLLTLERGTPLAAQLRVQCAEVSELLRNELMAKAGKKESAMLLPVVFLILPTIVITTLFPGILALGNLI